MPRTQNYGQAQRPHSSLDGGTAAGIPLGRQGKIDEIAATCLFLVTDDGGFITGQTIHVNGGSAYY